ncbi:MAG: 5-formyltetrahydrofolate cyclo-ligase [Elusimicrobia bacterium]|nr:5-formyltetrahydrofolate cyclo-ligase [Elusimicrobiota bacterium]
MSALTKQEIRKKILDQIRTQKEEDAFRKSQAICQKFLALPVFHKAKTILFYASCKGEVDTFAMMGRALERNKHVAVPIADTGEKRIRIIRILSTKDLHPGAYGIPEPDHRPDREIAPEAIDCVVVPGVAFDRAKNRLGRGEGYYDRFLSRLPKTTPVIALAYDFQVLDHLPGLEPHDRPVTLILTN